MSIRVSVGSAFAYLHRFGSLRNMFHVCMMETKVHKIIGATFLITDGPL